MQSEWIGRSEGAEIDFALDDGSGEHLEVFTTRPDTIFGATYMVVAPEHPLVERALAASNGPEARRVRRVRAEPRRRRSPAGQGEDRLPDGRLRDQSRDRRAHPDLDRRLRPHGLRHRRDHGGARPRRARLRVREGLRAADRTGRRDRRARPSRAPPRPRARASRSNSATPRPASRSTALRPPRPRSRSSRGLKRSGSARSA